MSTLIRIAFPLVAYLCVGTVISATVGYGYLRHTGRLDDDVMFRMVALVQGVDLDALAQEGARTLSETPPEEASFVEQQEKIHTATLHFDAKQKQVAASLVEFEFQLKRLTEAQERYSL
ncbi:MAG TPA: hypothetical protein PKC18_02235, partial [Lacipirellulaceae bacterium]|nr:hypothetical protein [Lacipirellulaceae bacterium]